jgi:hypothetical protein
MHDTLDTYAENPSNPFKWGGQTNARNYQQDNSPLQGERGTRFRGTRATQNE